MNKKVFFNKLEELMELDEGDLVGTEKLADLEQWDSLAVMGFIAMVDKEFNITLETDRIALCKTVNDLIGLLGNKVTE